MYTYARVGGGGGAHRAQCRPCLFDEDRRYTVDQDIYDAMDNDNRAIARLHEITYREAITTWKQADSRNSRYLNALIVSDILAGVGMDKEAYLRRLAKTGFLYGIDDRFYPANELKFYADGTLKSRIHYPKDWFTIDWDYLFIPVLSGERLYFKPDGSFDQNATLLGNGHLRDLIHRRMNAPERSPKLPCPPRTHEVILSAKGSSGLAQVNLSIHDFVGRGGVNPKDAELRAARIQSRFSSADVPVLLTRAITKKTVASRKVCLMPGKVRLHFKGSSLEDAKPFIVTIQGPGAQKPWVIQSKIGTESTVISDVVVSETGELLFEGAVN